MGRAESGIILTERDLFKLVEFEFFFPSALCENIYKRANRV